MVQNIKSFIKILIFNAGCCLIALRVALGGRATTALATALATLTVSLRCKTNRICDTLQGAAGTLAHAPDNILAAGKGLADSLADACEEGRHCSTEGGYFCWVGGLPFGGTIRGFYGTPACLE